MNEIKGRIHSIQTLGTLDGPGIRTVVFFQGCPLHCKFCHNIDCAIPTEGTAYTVSQLTDEIMKNKEYWGTLGGVTFSGGEPTFQPSFLEATVVALKKSGVHIAIDSCSMASKLFLEKIAKYVDLWMLSLKHFDDEKHIELTGSSNRRILENIRFLDALITEKKLRSKIRLRFLVIPSITDEKAHLQKVVDFALEVKNLEGIEVLAYGSHAAFKWKELYGSYEFENIPDATDDDVSLVKTFFRDAQVTVLY